MAGGTMGRQTAAQPMLGGDKAAIMAATPRPAGAFMTSGEIRAPWGGWAPPAPAAAMTSMDMANPLSHPGAFGGDPGKAAIMASTPRPAGPVMSSGEMRTAGGGWAPQQNIGNGLLGGAAPWGYGGGLLGRMRPAGMADYAQQARGTGMGLPWGYGGGSSSGGMF